MKGNNGLDDKHPQGLGGDVVSIWAFVHFEDAMGS
jgi:hypothetical protein